MKTYIPGSTARLNWTFPGDPFKAALAWYFTKRRVGSNETEIALKFRTDATEILNSSLPKIGIELMPPRVTLVLTNVDERYNGKYRFHVQVVRDGGEAEVELYIAEKPNVTFTCLSLNEVNEDDNFTCVCKGEGGNPPADVTWFKDDVQIGGIGKENKTLSLINVNETSNGIYKCEARSYTNDSFADKKSIKLVVRKLNKPNITFFAVAPDPVVKEGHKVTITCISKGVPDPDNDIFRNGIKISTEKTSNEVNTEKTFTEVSTEKTSTTYTIDFVTPGDAGIYTCIAENKVGNDSATLSLTVQGQITPTPKISRPTTSQPISSITSSNGTVGSATIPTSTSNGPSIGIIMGIIAFLLAFIVNVVLVVYGYINQRRNNAEDNGVRNRNPGQEDEGNGVIDRGAAVNGEGGQGDSNLPMHKDEGNGHQVRYDATVDNVEIEFRGVGNRR